MRAIHRDPRRLSTIVALAMLIGAGTTGAMTATAAAPSPPVNDNYLASLNLNKPGSPLDRKDTLRDERDTTAASIQPDILSPPSHGGPAELTGCNGVGESGTVWYDF